MIAVSNGGVCGGGASSSDRVGVMVVVAVMVVVVILTINQKIKIINYDYSNFVCNDHYVTLNIIDYIV